MVTSYGARLLHERSHGESFFALMTNRFGGSALYVLDEAEAALSPSRQLAMLGLMHQLAQLESQFTIAGPIGAGSQQPNTHYPLIPCPTDFAGLAWIVKIRLPRFKEEIVLTTEPSQIRIDVDSQG
jgi:hypothetical protein